MSIKSLPLATAVAAAALLGAAMAQAQATPAAKPSPYQGVSHPPSDDVIVTNDDQPAQAPAQPTSPTGISASHPAADAASSSSELSSKGDDQAPRLQANLSSARPANPDSEIVTYAPGPPNALPEGTVFRARMLGEIMASDATPGTPFRAKLSQDLMHNGRIVVPVGSELRGKVTYTSSGRRIGGPSVVHLVPYEFVLPDGTSYRVHAEVIDTAGSDTKATGEGNITNSGHGKRALVELAAGTGSGALVGAAVAGPAGAAIGSAVGAGVLGAHWLLANQAVDIPENSTIVFSLTDPMLLTPMRSE